MSLGFEPRDLLTARVDVPSSFYESLEKVQTFSDAVLARVRALPGVTSASIGTNPVQLSSWQNNFRREGVEATTAEQPNAQSEVVAPDYFATLKAPIVRGRALDARDKKGAPLAVVIDETLARQHFPGEDPIGKRLGSSPGDGEGSEERFYEIVGVVGRMQFRGFDDPTPLPALFFSQGQVQRNNLAILARSTVGKASLEKSIREIVASIDPTLPLYDVRSMMERVEDTWSAPRLLTSLLAVFAGLALLLASIGLYGVISYTVLRRMREIGVRLALGAQRGHIRALIGGHGARLLGIGLCFGMLGAVAQLALAAKRSLRRRSRRFRNLSRRRNAPRDRRCSRLLAADALGFARRSDHHPARRMTPMKQIIVTILTASGLSPLRTCRRRMIQAFQEADGPHA